LKYLNEKEEKIADSYYDLELNSINENKKIHILRNKANILTYQLNDFGKCNIMNQLFEFSFGEKYSSINGFILSSCIWPIDKVY